MKFEFEEDEEINKNKQDSTEPSNYCLKDNWNSQVGALHNRRNYFECERKKAYANEIIPNKLNDVRNESGAEISGPRLTILEKLINFIKANIESWNIIGEIQIKLRKWYSKGNINLLMKNKFIKWKIQLKTYY
jgi:hypothetical protein